MYQETINSHTLPSMGKTVCHHFRFYLWLQVIELSSAMKLATKQQMVNVMAIVLAAICGNTVTAKLTVIRLQ